MGLKMYFSAFIFTFVVFSGYETVNGQSLAVPASISQPIVNGSVGNPASLSCGSLGMPINLCLWERMNSEGSNLILTFDTKARSGLTSGISGYNYVGESLTDGECGFKIRAIREDDFKKWQCTLIANDKIFRGYVQLRKQKTEADDASNKTVVQGSVSPANSSGSFVPVRQSRQFFQTVSSSNPVGLPRGRPIVTAETVGDSDFSRSLTQDTSVGIQVQEVQVQSSGLEIKQKRGRKLVIL